MKISAAIERLKNDEAIVVRDKTFPPRGVDEATLETGELVYLAYAKDGMWLSLDPASEEILLFEDLDEEVEPEDETVVYGGKDYEFSYEGTVTIAEDDGDVVTAFKEYESADGEVVRVMEEEATGDITASYGIKITEEELQEA